MAYTSHVPPPSEPAEVLRFLDACESEADKAVEPLIPQWKQAANLYRTGAPEPYGNDPPLFSANMIQPATRRGAASLSENKPKLDVRPRRDGLQTTATVLRRTIDAGWDEQSVGMRLEDLTLLVRTLGYGFMSIDWDPEANYGLGDIVVGVRDPRQVRVDPATRRAYDMDRAQYVIDRDVLPMADLAATYPDVADRLKPCGRISPIEETESQQRRGIGVTAQIRTWMGRAKDGGGGAPIPRVERVRYWIADPARDEDDLPLYPGGRLIVRASGDVICEDTQNPYYDGHWPYEMLDGIPDLDGAAGISETEAVKRIHETFNRIGNAGAQATLREMRSWAIMDDGALRQQDVDAFSNLGFRVITKRRQFEFRHEPPPITVQSISQWLSMCQGLIDYLEGLQGGSAMGGSKGRVELRSPGLLEGLQQSEQILIRSQARRLESFLSRLGQKWISRIFQFYTQDRLMHFIGANGKWENFAYQHAELQKEILALAINRAVDVWQEKVRKASEDSRDGESVIEHPGGKPDKLNHDEILLAMKGAWRDFPLRVEPFSSLSTTRQARAAEKATLNQQALLPGYMVLEELGYDNPKELAAEAVEEAKKRAEAGVPGLMAQANPKKKAGGKK